MTEPTRTRTRWRAVHALTPGQRIKPALAAATVDALFGRELIAALQRRGLLPADAAPAPAPARRAATQAADAP